MCPRVVPAIRLQICERAQDYDPLGDAFAFFGEEEEAEASGARVAQLYTVRLLSWFPGSWAFAHNRAIHACQAEPAGEEPAPVRAEAPPPAG